MAKKTYADRIREACKKHGVTYANDFPDHPIFKQGYTIRFMGGLTKPSSDGPPATAGPASPTTTPTEPEA